MVMRQSGMMSQAGMVCCTSCWLLILLPVYSSHVRQVTTVTTHRHLLEHLSQRLVDAFTADRHVHQLPVTQSPNSQCDVPCSRAQNTGHSKHLTSTATPTGTVALLTKTKRSNWSSQPDTSDTDTNETWSISPPSQSDIASNNSSFPPASDTPLIKLSRRHQMQHLHHQQRHERGHGTEGSVPKVNKRIIGTNKLAIGLDLHTLSSRLPSYRRHYYEDQMKDARDKLHNLGRRSASVFKDAVSQGKRSAAA